MDLHATQGQKIALLVGCNYPNDPDPENVLDGCHNDALGMREALITHFGFDPKHIELLIDKPGSSTMPTAGNIKRSLFKMVGRAKRGDVLFFFFAGHGVFIEPPHVTNEEHAIVASDDNVITSVDFRQIVNRVPKGATFTILSDSCHSGGLIDKEKEQIGPVHSNARSTAQTDHGADFIPRMIPFQSLLERLRNLAGNSSATDLGTLLVQVFNEDASIMFRDPAAASAITLLKPDQGILLSGCQKYGYSYEVRGESRGAFSRACQIIFKENRGRPLSNRDIVLKAREIIPKLYKIKNQHPCLYCSDENAGAIFLGKPPRPTTNDDQDDED